MANQYKKTTNLPKTGFPMRAGLASSEPRRLAKWEENDVYELVRSQNEGHKTFVLHDGPPYANGPIHLGHALNKIIKDFINRYQIMQGRQIAYVPGWDCHGQPIEHKVEEHLGTKKFNETDPYDIRQLCRRFAVENIDLQKTGFRRLGVLGDWAHPYLTLSNTHDAADIEVFKKIWDSGAIYRGRKPVHWCTHCHTALAEAEIEYADVTGPSIYVGYAMKERPEGLESIEEPLYVMIWTTTPWTLPANAAVAMKPEAIYTAIKHDGKAYIVLADLAQKVCEVAGWDLDYVEVNGKPWQAVSHELEGLTYAQPIFDDVTCKVILADYVGTEDGTGIVHIAPGHGADDFYVGVENDVPIIMPVDDDGRFYQGDTYGTGGPWSGMEVTEANPKIIQWLDERGVLVHAGKITHSYPHCWRCKNPVIFRATEQWFVSMDDTHLRDNALDAIEHDVRWYPAHSAKRIYSMIEGRPDWCISRQRVWGVPIPAFTCADCGATVMNDATLDAVIRLFNEKGSDAWFMEDPSEYLGDADVCPECGGHHLKANKDILDVWWDSGVSHTAVLQSRPELRFPADLYVEGSDQHRGWFQSSLLTSMGAYGCPPFKGVLTNGFTLDGQGRKMSKSLGNTIDPGEVCDSLGAEIVRLWVASIDATTDMPCDKQILERVSDAYRRFRNTFRFLLGELEGQFDPAVDGIPFNELTAYDRMTLARLAQVHQKVSDAYADYRFNLVYRTLYDYVITELSNGYLNATKDRMYCDAADSVTRRSCQTVWYEILSMLLRDLQPILAYTTDEVLEYVPVAMREGKDFAALLSWYEAPTLDQDETLLAAYNALLEVRSAYTKAYEEALASEVITEKTTQATKAHVVLPQDDPAMKSLYEVMGGDLAEPLVCSQVQVSFGPELSVTVEPAAGEKCPRCWNWRELGEDGLCDRCHEALDAEQGEE